MTDDLERVDRDGALAEALGPLVPATRGRILRTLAAAGLIGSAAALTGAGTADAAGEPQGDVAILNYALTLEYLEAEFYKQAVANQIGNGSNKAANTFAKVVAGHEAAHVTALKKALGSKAVAKPKFDFKDTVTNVEKFIATAITLEDAGVAAYLGQAGNIKSKGVLAAAGSILPVEARHAAWIRNIAGKTPAPAAFEAGATKAQILAAVKKTGFIVV